jgi:hypothetical protein
MLSLGENREGENASEKNKKKASHDALLGKRLSVTGESFQLLASASCVVILRPARFAGRRIYVLPASAKILRRAKSRPPQDDGADNVALRQPLTNMGIQLIGRTVAPFPPVSLSGEGLEGRLPR